MKASFFSYTVIFISDTWSINALFCFTICLYFFPFINYFIKSTFVFFKYHSFSQLFRLTLTTDPQCVSSLGNIHAKLIAGNTVAGMLALYT